MTVSSQIPYNSSTYAGSATFVFGFQIILSTDLQVSVNGVAQPASNYSISGVGVATGGSITYTGTLTIGDFVELQRVTVLQRLNDYQTQGDYLAATINADYDRIWMALQEQQRNQAQTIRVPETAGVPVLPAAAARKGTLLGFDAVTGALTLIAGAVGSALALAAQYAGSAGATLIGYLSPGTGATLRTIYDALTDLPVSSKSFGAKGDFNFGTNTGTNDTAGIQAWMNYCAANKRKGRLVGAHLVDLNALVPPAAGQLHIIGAGAARTFDSALVNRNGTAGQAFLRGSGTDKSLAFVRFEDVCFDGPGINSGTLCFDGDMYEGGTQGCVYRNWDTAHQAFGSLNTHKHNRYISCKNGNLVTNWPAGTSQASASTTTFLSERNDYSGCTVRGLSLDTSTTGAGNIVSSASVLDTFEGGCGTALYVNKSFDFLLMRPHSESSLNFSFQFIDSSPTVINPYLAGGDGARESYTWPGASANGAGYNRLDLNGLLTRGIFLKTKNGTAAMTANDAGGIDLAGAGLVTPWTPALGASSGTTTGNAYSLQEGYVLKFGKLVIAPWRIVLTAKDAGMGGILRINNLPFAADAAFSNAYGNQIRYSGVTFSGGAFTELVADINGTIATLTKQGSGLAPTNLTPAEISGTATLSGAFIYLGAS